MNGWQPSDIRFISKYGGVLGVSVLPSDSALVREMRGFDFGMDMAEVFDLPGGKEADVVGQI
jgi:hypothetical protein